ncbi:hypothetical protein EH165_14765 [Nakamurella antarctica]|uniref:YdhG-like domain-containing protein n=1 Tax=Nakamurella antarctica TaxID=1902245 RepID=A0A3G8ZPL7_9ACTN|nr:hypothetical protein [Nakamurella antarctica]AZI59213.1 hypothetical protein EH165_14765 [Nakamurella antarctica]
MGPSQLDDVYSALRGIMLKHAKDLVAATDSSGHLSIEAKEPGGNGMRSWYGGVQTKKNYVSYHLMAVYEDPELLNDISTKLRVRMQGKSCFNFNALNDELFAELDALTGVGFCEFALRHNPPTEIQ